VDRQRLLGLETRRARFEECYAAHGDGEWFAQIEADPPASTSAVARLLRDRCLHVQTTLPEQGPINLSDNGVLIDLKP